MANVERLKEARAWALSNPEHFDMGSWTRVKLDADHNPCGTTMCLSGYAASKMVEDFFEKLKGVVLKIDPDDLSCEDIEEGVEIGLLPDGRDIGWMGYEYFELTEEEGYELFHSEHEWLERIDKLIEKYSNG